MSNILLQYGVISIPLGVVVAIFAFQFMDGWRLHGSMIIAIVLLFFGGWAFREAEKFIKKESRDVETRHKELIREIRGFREEMRGNNERNNKSANNL